MTLCLPLMHFFYALFPVHNWWDTRVPRRLITVELGFAIELHAAYRYTFEEKRHRVLVNVVVTSRGKKKSRVYLFFFLFSALMFVLPHSISNNEFLSSRCTKVKLFLVFFFQTLRNFSCDCSPYKKSFCRKSFFFFFSKFESIKTRKIGQ